MNQNRYGIFDTFDRNMRTWITQPKRSSNIDHPLEFVGMTYENKYSVYTDK